MRRMAEILKRKAPRASGSLTIAFGLLGIPVKRYAAASAAKARFTTLNPETGNRIKQQLVDDVTGDEVARADTIKGVEISKGAFVQFDAEEIDALLIEQSGDLRIQEFIKASEVEAVQIEKIWYLGPDSGGGRAYELLARVMKSKKVVAVAVSATRGKETLNVIVPHKGGLALHQLYYENELRDFGSIDLGPKSSVSAKEVKAAESLVAKMMGVFEPGAYRDGFADRLADAVAQKAAGMDIVIPAKAPDKPTNVVDLFDALQASLNAGKKKKSRKSAAKKKKTG